MYCRVVACDFDGTGAENGQLAPEVSAALGTARAQGSVTLLVTGRVLEEIQAACSGLSVFDAVVPENGALVKKGCRRCIVDPEGSAGPCSPDAGGGLPRWILRPERQSQAFRFLYTDAPAPVIARNVMEFHDAVQTVPLGSLRHHLSAGGFSRWAVDVLGDEQLARGLRKLERIMSAKITPDRKKILAHIEDHLEKKRGDRSDKPDSTENIV